MRQNTSEEPGSGLGCTRVLTFERIEDGRIPESVNDFAEAEVREATDSDSRADQSMARGGRPHFSLRLAFLAVTGLAILFMVIGHQWRLHRQRMGYQRARAFVQNALHDRHLKQWHPATAGMNAHAAHGDHGSVLPQSWEFDVIDVTTGTVSLDLSKSAQSLDEFEREAVQQIHAGATEIGNVSMAGDVRYVTTINSSKECAACHAKSGTIAVVSVRGPE